MKPQAEKNPGWCQTLDTFVLRVGRVTAWLNVLLMLIIILQVVLRYAFSEGMVWLEELQWHLYAVCIMFGISFALAEDVHIRLDILHQRFSPRTKEWVDFLGMLFLVLPLAAILFWYGVDFTSSALRVGESSPSPLGLPYRWIIKAAFPVSMFLLFTAAFSRMLRAAVFIFGKRQAV
jgi:TRAP-type mannitol/chloroaromatic compound transport system permease small subunit